MPQQNRQLAAILFTDIVGYTAMMQQDEQNAVAVTRHYISVLKQSVAIHHGKILNDYGDGSLCSFSSATEAMRCAIEMQQQLQNEPMVPLRIGLHVGELFFEGNKVMGDGVNVASRIQSLGIANSILFSQEINNKLKNQQEFKSISVGRFEFKNVDEPMEVFALANEGLIVPKKEELSGKLKENQKKSALKKWLALATLIVLLVTGFFIYKNFSSVIDFKGDKSIAVLPFENTGAVNSEEYISDGITNDIINSLSKISSLQKVIGWASVKSLKKTNKTLKTIAGELGVSAILTGTIQVLAGKTRIIAELIEVSTNKRLWGDDFEYVNKDILSVQSNVAGQIVNALQASITTQEKKELSRHYTDNPEAYKYYLRGRYFWDFRTAVNSDSAEANYKKAINLDPGYALAYAGLADLFIFSNRGQTQLEGVPIGRDYANKALSLDSTLVEAITTIGFIQGVFDYDWKKAKQTLENAIKLNKGYAYAHIFYGNLLQYTGQDTEKGIEEIKKARDLDPLSTSINWILGRNYYMADKYDLAEEQYKRTLTLNPNFPLTKPFLAYTLIAQKKYTEAMALIKQIPKNGISQTNLYQTPILSYAYAVSGNMTQAKAEFDMILKDYPYTNHTFIALAAIGLKDFDRALTELEKAVAEKELYLYFLKVDPIYRQLKNEPRYKSLLKKMNLD